MQRRMAIWACRAARAAGAAARQIAVWIVGFALLGGAAHAANLMKVRIGNHPDKTRIVLEMDAATRHRVMAHDADEILVRVDADSVPEAIAGNGQPLLWVRIEPRLDGTDVRLQVGSQVKLEEMVLEGPDRIVLDLVPGPAPVAFAPEPPAIEPEPEPEPAPLAPEPAPEPELAVVEPAEPPSAAPEEPVEAPVAEPELAPTPPSDVGQVELADRAPKPAASVPPSRSGNPLAILGNPMVLGALGLVILLLAFWAVRRRSRGAASDAADDGDDDVVTEADETTGSIGAAFAQADAVAGDTDGSIFDVAEAEVVGDGDVAAQEDDYPAIPGAPTATATASAAPSAPLDTSELGDEMAAIVQELERRMAHLETRLEEVVDAKERLERQVSAQTEELRVQRAAIARTQRVLRGISRPEDEATDPAPK